MIQRHMPIGYQMAEGKILINQEKAKMVEWFFRTMQQEFPPMPWQKS